MIAETRRLFASEDWANGRTLASLQETATGEAVALMAHILAAREVWLARMTEADVQGLEVFPAWDLATCVEKHEAMAAAYKAHLASLDDAALAEVVHYHSTSGKASTNTRLEIFQHLTHHGAYHRGQIAAQVRAAGGVPAVTDVIYFCRQGA